MRDIQLFGSLAIVSVLLGVEAVATKNFEAAFAWVCASLSQGMLWARARKDERA